MRKSEIEIMLEIENREKRRTSSGARHNSGRRGGGTRGVTGAMRFPSDLLKSSDKKAYKEYTKPGGIIMSNVYDDINNVPSVAELKAKDFDASRSIVVAAKASHKIKDLISHWGVSSGGVYKVFDYYEIKYPKRPKKISNAEKPALSKVLEDQAKVLEEARTSKEVMYTPAVLVEAEDFQLKYIKKSVKGNEAELRINNYMNILIPNKKYDIKLVIRELPDDENLVTEEESIKATELFEEFKIKMKSDKIDILNNFRTEINEIIHKRNGEMNDEKDNEGSGKHFTIQELEKRREEEENKTNE